MENGDQQKHINEALELRDKNQPCVVSVESRKKRRRNCLIALLILLAVALIVVAIVVPLVLLKKDDKTSGIKPTPDDSLGTTRTPTTFHTGWSYWTFCSVTCGNGTRMRTRRCDTCDVTKETKPCQMKACTADWNQWGPWSPCSKTCSTGTQYRSRNCSETEIKCIGDGQQTRGCTLLSVCPATDCSAWLRFGNTSNGIYSIDPDRQGSFSVYCDMTTDGGGWTVFQRRQNESYQENFYRNWEEYKIGFGNLSGEFWLGNDYIHRLTASLNASLLVNIEDWSGNHHNASYGIFDVASENSNYTLTVLQYTGNAGDSLSGHNGMDFTTYDRDNDKEGASNCANGYRGGWWYNACITANLNGKYVGNTRDRQGIIWLALSTMNFQTMKATEMKLRPRP